MKYKNIINTPKNMKRIDRWGLGPPINWDIPPNNKNTPINICEGYWRLYKSNVAPTYMYIPNMLVKMVVRIKKNFCIFHSPPLY